MNWFGETFGESLSSLKGQITKITKEVLAENDNDRDDEKESPGRRDGDSTFSSWDSEEVRDLKEENQRIREKFEEELKLLREENERLKWSVDAYHSEGSFLRDDQIREVCELENELQQLKIERDHLEELQKDHQSNICLVIKQRDDYKRELEELKRKYSGLESEHEELLKREKGRGISNKLCEVSLDDTENKDEEVIALRKTVEKLEGEIDLHHSEREEAKKEIEKHMQECKSLKEDIEKLREEINSVNKDKESAEVENRKLNELFESLKCDLNIKTEELDKEHKVKSELEESIMHLKQMFDDTQAQESKFRTYMETEINKLLEAFGAPNVGEMSNNRTLSESLNIIEAIWLKNLRERKEFEDASNRNYERLHNEAESLKEIIRTLEDEVKKEIAEKTESESKYREEINLLRSKCSDLQARVEDSSMAQEVTRLRDEVAKLTEDLESRSRELTEAHANMQSLAREEQEWAAVIAGKEVLERMVSELETRLQMAQEKMTNLERGKSLAEERCAALELEVNQRTQEMVKVDESVRESTRRMEEIEKATEKRTLELEKECAELRQLRIQLESQMEYLKAQVIIKESEAKRLEERLAGEMNGLQEEVARLKGVDEELRKWKEATVDLELQRQDLSEEKEALERECLELKARLAEREGAAEPGTRMDAEKCAKEEAEALRSENEALRTVGHQQETVIACLGEENAQLRRNYQQALATFDEQFREMYVDRGGVPQEKSSGVQQHRRSKSDAAEEIADHRELRTEIERLKEQLDRQTDEYRALQDQHAVVSEREARSKKELERLRLHLIEIENDYGETIEEYKTKLAATEEQLKNSSTFYTSAKVRDNQHLESLQSQIRLISAQRDDLQRTLSTVEDEVQKHKAALTSFHVVLEQFQQDKARELESMAAKYETEILTYERRLAEAQAEMVSLNANLSEAKNGLKAASRLGEQLERKNQQIAELEERISAMATAAKELEEKAAAASQSTSGKIDKSLIKNLLIGYLSSQQADRKAQVLRIMTSVLELDAEERAKIGVDSSQAGWLSSLLNPRSSDTSDSSPSLSEAFIRFLESESRPRPQVKLLPEQNRGASTARSSRPSSTPSPKPSLLLQELVLPTFSTPQTNESTILKDVLKDS